MGKLWRAAGLAVAGALAAGAAHADVYALQADNDDTFYRVDVTTGVATLLGTTPAVYSDFAAVGGSLYSGAYGGTGWYRINPATGAGALLGNTGLNNFAAGSVGSTAYEVDRDTGDLYTIAPSTGAPTLVGPTGVSIGGTMSLSNGLSGLYYTQNSNLYLLDTTTGAASLVGTFGVSNFEGVTQIGGVDYGVSSSGVLASFVPGGATTVLSAETGITGTPYALAPGGPGGVPEPATWMLMLSGVGMTGAGLRFGRRVRIA